VGTGKGREGVEGWRGAVKVSESSATGTVRGVNAGLTVILVEGLRGDPGDDERIRSS
jgi:hypothetical protein